MKPEPTPTGDASPPPAFDDSIFRRHRFLGRAGLTSGTQHSRQIVLYGRVSDWYWYGADARQTDGTKSRIGFADMRKTLLAALDHAGYELVVFFGITEGLFFGTPEMRARRDRLFAPPNEDSYGAPSAPAPTPQLIPAEQHSLDSQMRELLRLATGEDLAHEDPEYPTRIAVVIERAQNLVLASSEAEAADRLERLAHPRAGNLVLWVCDTPHLRDLPGTLFGRHRSGLLEVSVGLPKREEIERLIAELADDEASRGEIPPANEVMQRLMHLDCVAILNLTERARALGLPFNVKTLRRLGGQDDEGPWNGILKEGALRRLDSALQKLRGQAHVLEHVRETLRGVHNTLRMQRDGFRFDDRPLAVFFFAGPTGVGKTEVFRILEREFSGVRSLKINMGEYTQQHQMMRFVGAPPSYRGHPKGELGQFLLDHPSSIILFDEFEKAHAVVMDCFLSMLEGSLTTGDGDRIDMSQTVIFITSNAAADDLVAVRDDHPAEERRTLREKNVEKIVEALKNKHHVRPELIGRLAHTLLAFNGLDDSTAALIIDDALREVEKRTNDFLKHLGAQRALFDKSGRDYYIKKWSATDKKKYGARELVNEIKEKLVNAIISALYRAREEHPEYDGAWLISFSETGAPLLRPALTGKL